jgi:hypothetical protein
MNRRTCVSKIPYGLSLYTKEDTCNSEGIIYEKGLGTSDTVPCVRLKSRKGK